MLKTLLKSAVVACAAISSAQATQIDWNLNSGTSWGSYYESLSYDMGGITLTATAWSDTYGSADNRIRQGWLGSWNGLGVCNLDEGSCHSPEHAIDNYSSHGSQWSDFDMILLSFSSAVKLTDINIGWKQSDSDASLLAYTGFDDPSLYNDTWSGLYGSGGWSLVGQYANVAQAPGYTSVNDGGLVSQHWLVGAYNPLFGDEGWTEGNDFFKLKSLKTETVQVPEPTALALLGMGLLSLGALRRRRQTLAG